MSDVTLFCTYAACSGAASTGGKGNRVKRQKITKNSGGNCAEIGKRSKIWKRRQKSGRFVHLAPVK